MNKTLQEIFGAENAPISLFFVPTYPTGMWCFQYGIKGDKHPKKVTNQSEMDEFAAINGLRYYNSEVHSGSFATPNFVKDLVK